MTTTIATISTNPATKPSNMTATFMTLTILMVNLTMTLTTVTTLTALTTLPSPTKQANLILSM